MVTRNLKRRRAVGAAGTFLVMLAMLLATPTAARAQWMLSPSIGFNFSSDFADCHTLSGCEERRTGYGIGLGYLGTLFGFEQEITHTPTFFGSSVVSDENSVTTIMSNVLVILPLGPIRPYGTAGLGAIRTSADFDFADTLRYRDSGLGWVLGGGIMLFPTPHLGVRADVRHYRGTGDLEIGAFSFDGSPLNFSRASVAAVLRF